MISSLLGAPARSRGRLTWSALFRHRQWISPSLPLSQSGSGTLGAVTPAQTASPSGTSQSCTVSATSTSLGVNTISFTASDANASNSPQTTSATLTVLDHASASAAIVSGNNFVSHVRATALSATITLSNARACRSDLQVNATPRRLRRRHSQLSALPRSLLRLGGHEPDHRHVQHADRREASQQHSFLYADRRRPERLSGGPLGGSSSAAICGSGASRHGAWNSSSGSTPGRPRRWRSGPTPMAYAARPGRARSRGSPIPTSARIFAARARMTAIDLTGANPSLNTLNFSNSNYTFSTATVTPTATMA